MNDELFILWTNADPVTSEKMVFMYAHNAVKKEWWGKVTIIIWGATAEYVGTNEDIQKQIVDMMNDGLNVSACISCADQLGVSDVLRNMGIELIKWGEPLTRLIKEGKHLISI